MTDNVAASGGAGLAFAREGRVSRVNGGFAGVEEPPPTASATIGGAGQGTVT
jgi:hypothetical protein